jgi:hypothetical protein
VSAAEQLRAALDALVTAYLTACQSPKPSYSIGGQSVSWTEYLRMLLDGIKGTAEALAYLEPFELRSSVL